MFLSTNQNRIGKKIRIQIMMSSSWERSDQLFIKLNLMYTKKYKATLKFIKNWKFICGVKSHVLFTRSGQIFWINLHQFFLVFQVNQYVLPEKDVHTNNVFLLPQVLRSLSVRVGIPFLVGPFSYKLHLSLLMEQSFHLYTTSL